MPPRQNFNGEAARAAYPEKVSVYLTQTGKALSREDYSPVWQVRREEIRFLRSSLQNLEACDLCRFAASNPQVSNEDQ
jgi:hypothetical protein